MKRLKDIIECDFDILISGITDDSRLVHDGYLFVATKGFNVDHYDFIDKAIENGCSFVICDREFDFDFPHMIVDDINNLFYELCRKFYDLDFDLFNFIGITGTDGKTTTASIVKKLIGDAAYIGTNGLSVVDKHFSTSNTTPCVSELYKDLKTVSDNNCSNVVMEVSSEALLHDRVKDLRYKIVGFTNITGDHLNVHKTFENYRNCKLKLLDLVDTDGIIIINGDDDNLSNIKCNNKYSFGFSNDNDYVIRDVVYEKDKTLITIRDSINNDFIKLESPLIGKYNVYNVVMAYLIGYYFGIDKELLIKRVSEIGVIDGRCERLDFGQDFEIILDYAHTTNGIKNILSTFQNKYNRIITVTGCAGGREKEKRREIGHIIMSLSDISVFTMDDPRYEDVDDIIDQMVGDEKDYVRITDRVVAIHYALSIAEPNDVVLILGKGRDNYMAIKDKKIKYCDYDVIYKYMNGEM